MRISNTLFTSDFMTQMNQLQTQQLQLQNQSTSGLQFTTLDQNPTGMEQALNLQTQESAINQYQSSINQVQDSASFAATQMNSLQTMVEQAQSIANSAVGVNSPQELSAYASEIQGIIGSAVSVLNTPDAQGNYIFGGTVNSSPPFVTTTDSTGAITAVTYQGNANVAEVAISPNLTVTAQVVGANTTGTGPSGLITDSRSGADLFNHLIALQNDVASGNTAAITSTDKPNLDNDASNVINEIAANGVLQSTLQTVSNTDTQQADNLNTDLSNTTSTNMPQTLTQLDQVQSAFQAALQSGVMVMNLSILNYLH